MIALSAIAACALRNTPHYEPASFPLDPIDAAFATELPDVLLAELGGRRLPGVDGLDEAGVRALTTEAQYAIYGTNRRWARNSEIDLLVDVGRGPKPVTVWWGDDRAVRVETSDAALVRVARPPDVSVQAWGQRIADQHALAGFAGELAWLEHEIGDVAFGLARLRPDEAAVLHGVALLRSHTSPRAPGRELAYFDPSTEPPNLQFFDVAFESDELGFAGRPDAPIASGAMTALHEFAHVLADSPYREAYTSYLAAFDAWNDAPEDDPTLRAAMRGRYRAYRELRRGGPVLAAWDALRDGRKGPSSYGFRSRAESFAEAFALHHLDPAALERAMPGAEAWFVAGEHVRAAGLALATDARAP